MKYTTVNVQQLKNRKGKPWQARAKYKDNKKLLLSFKAR